MWLWTAVGMDWKVRGSNFGGDKIFRATQTGFCKGVKCPKRGTATHLLLVKRFEWVGAILLPPPLSVCIGISWGELYLYC